MRTGRPPRPLAVRLVEKIGPPDENGCWPWLGQIQGDGYGLITIGGKDEHVLRAHRVAYELLVDAIPEGLTLDHVCRNRSCVNPEHLEPVTIGENVLRGEGRSAYHARTGLCLRGHPLTDGNLYVRKSGRRECRTCVRMRAGAAYLRERAAQLRATQEGQAA